MVAFCYDILRPIAAACRCCIFAATAAPEGPHQMLHQVPLTKVTMAETTTSLRCEWPPPSLSDSFYHPHTRRMARYHGSLLKLYQAKYPDRPGLPRNERRRQAHAFKLPDSHLFSASARYLVNRMRKFHKPWPKWGQKGVVYAIFHCHAHDRMPARLMYVGQTFMSAFDRFKRHVSNSVSILNGAGSVQNAEAFWLHRYIARNGIDKLCVIPLETILWEGGAPDPDDSDWRDAARVVERRWVQWLRTLHPRGYNKCLPGTRQKTFTQVAPSHALWQPLPHAYSLHSDSSGYNLAPLIRHPYHCRDYYRRIYALAHSLPSSTPEHLQQALSRYRMRTLTRMHEIVRLHRLPSLPVDLQDRVTATIAGELQARRDRRRPSRGPRPLIVALFSNRILDELPLHQIVANPEVMQLLPDKLKQKGVRPMFAFKNPATIGQRWCNYASVFDGSTSTYAQLQELANQTQCACHQFPSEFKPDGHHGHVLTCDPAFLSRAFPLLPKLARLMKEGKKFRPPRSTIVNMASKGEAFTRVLTALQSFAQQQTRAYKLNPASGSFGAWISKVSTLVQEALLQMPTGLVLSYPDAPAYGTPEKEAMERLLRDFLCTYCDKSANNLAFVCKKHAVHAVLADMHRGTTTHNSTYVRMDTSPEAIIRSLQTQISRVGRDPQHASLPVISLLPKMHKDIISWRFLSLSFKNFLRPSAVLLTRALRALQPDMYKLWNTLKFPAPTGWNAWVLPDSAAFMPVVHDFNASRSIEQHDFPPFLHQFDFERLYTELDQADLIDKLHQFVDMAFARHPNSALKISNRQKNNFKWVSLARVPIRPSNRESYMSCQQVKDLISLIVRHAYARVGDAVFKQVKGIPMGVNPACFFANLYLFMYEFNFFKQLLALNTPTSRRLLQAFRFSGRLIDDVNVITHEDKTFIQQYFYHNNVHAGIRGLYPSPLNLQDSSHANPHESNFLDLHIQPANGDHGPLRTTIFDKRQQPAFLRRLRTIRFPAPYSMLSKRCKLNVFDSQFTRYARLITDVEPFIDAVAKLMLEMVNKGYVVAQVMNRCRLQVRDHPYLFGAAPGVATRYRHARGLFRAIESRFHDLCVSSVGH